jgi:hypothetical protein
MAPGAANKGIRPIETATRDRAGAPSFILPSVARLPLLVGRRVQTSGMIAVDARMQSKIDPVLSPDQQEKLKDLQRTHESVNGEGK